MQRVTVFKYWFLLLFICREEVEESLEEDEDKQQADKKKKKGAKAKEKKSTQNKMTVSVDTSKKANGGKHQAILFDQSSAKETLDKSADSSEAKEIVKEKQNEVKDSLLSSNDLLGISGVDGEERNDWNDEQN